MTGNVFVDRSVAYEPTTSLLRNVYARRTTATTSEAVLPSVEKPVARLDEPKSITIPNSRFAGNMQTVNHPSPAEEVYPHNFMVEQPKTTSRSCSSKNSLRLRHTSAGRRSSKLKCVLVLLPFGINGLD